MAHRSHALQISLDMHQVKSAGAEARSGRAMLFLAFEGLMHV